MGYVICGAGGAGKTVAGILRARKESITGFLDDSPKASEVTGIPVIGALRDRVRFADEAFIIAFGTRFQKEKLELFDLLRRENCIIGSAIFPDAYVDPYARVGVGIVVAAGARILPGAQVDDACFMCAGASVDHDCRVERGVYLAPGAILCGAVEVEEGAFIGANATILPEIKVGRFAIVGAGAVVAQDVEPNTVVVGVPARSR